MCTLLFVCALRGPLTTTSQQLKCSSSRRQYIKRLLFVRTRQSLLIKHRLFSTEELVRRMPPPQKKKKLCSRFFFLIAMAAASWFTCRYFYIVPDVSAHRRGLELVRKRATASSPIFFFLAFLLSFRDETVSWLPYSDSLWEMRVVIKQFPVCKCPVYTFLLQSLSLDRLLEWEKHSHRMKNENGRASIMRAAAAAKKSIVALSQLKKRLKRMS